MIEKIIDNETSEQLKKKFEAELRDDVEMMLFINEIVLDGAQGQQEELNIYTEKFINELAALSPKIKAVKKGTASGEAKELGITTSPSLAIGRDKGYKIVYNGAPLGHEATGVIETAGFVSRGDSGLPDDLKEMLKKIKKETQVKVFVTPDCPYCPKAVIQANRLAVEAKGIIFSECVESAENNELALKFDVSSVPMQIINNEKESGVLGAQTD
ncbi:MAG: thioredoxin family protein, partial [bacterium]